MEDGPVRFGNACGFGCTTPDLAGVDAPFWRSKPGCVCGREGCCPFGREPDARVYGDVHGVVAEKVVLLLRGGFDHNFRPHKNPCVRRFRASWQAGDRHSQDGASMLGQCLCVAW